MSGFYFRAISANWTKDIGYWIKQQKVAPATMLAFAMLHQCSPVRLSRLHSCIC